jgi:hypothetical protein
VPPINGAEPPRQHVYVFNGTFFSYGVDSKDAYKVYRPAAQFALCGHGLLLVFIFFNSWEGCLLSAHKPFFCFSCLCIYQSHGKGLSADEETLLSRRSSENP